MRQLASGAVLLFAFTGVASADSDGYFCISDGYLAYELGAWSAPDQRHVLRILFVGGEDGISEPTTVLLDDFQLHGMKCEPDKVVILSFDKKYTLGLAGREPPQIRSVEPIPTGQIPNDALVNSLDRFRRSSSFNIPSSRKERSYQLQIAYRENRDGLGQGGGIILHETTSTLIEKDLDGKVLRESVVHKGVTEETID